MARRALTDAAIRKLSTSKPSEYVWHTKWPHRGSFGVRVHKTGRKTWLYRENLQAPDGKSKTVSHTLGTFPDLYLAEAMRQAEQIARVGSASHGWTVADLADELIRRYHIDGASEETARRRRQTLDSHVLPAIGKERVMGTTTLTLQRLVDDLEADGQHATAADVAYTLRAMFRRVLALGIHHTNPAAGLVLAKRDRRSKRGKAATIDIDVLARVWNTAERLYREAEDNGHSFYARQFLAVQLQVATVQRTRVTMELDREYLRDGWWEHPGDYIAEVEHDGKTLRRRFRTKSGRPHGIPLLPLIQGRIERITSLVPDDQRFLLASFYRRKPFPLNRYHANVLDAIREGARLTKRDWWPHLNRKIYTTLMHREGHDLGTIGLVEHHTPPGSDTVTGHSYLEQSTRDPRVEEMLTHWHEMLVDALETTAEGVPLRAV